MTSVYEAPNGTEYNIAKDSQTGLIKFLPTAGGSIPTILSGFYTQQRYADEAWQRYVKSCKKKPDQRLKVNKAIEN